MLKLRRRSPIKKSLIGGKRGNMIVDSITVLVILCVFGLVLFLSYLTLSQWNTEMQADDEFSDAAKNVTSDITQAYPSYMDNGFVFILIGLWVASVVASFFIDSHPVFFIMAFLALIFVIIVSGYMSNAFVEVSEDAELTTTAQAFPKTLWVFENLITIIVVYGLSIGLALYAKVKAG